MTKAKNKDVDYYLALPYTIEVAPIASDEGGGYTACIPLLGRYSAVGDGDTAEEAVSDLKSHMPSLIADWLREGIAIPEPENEDKSVIGSIYVRLPKALRSKV